MPMVSKFKKAIKKMLGLTVAFGIVFSLSAQWVFSGEKSVQKETNVDAILYQLPSLWKFKIDPEDAGLKEGWFKPDYNDKGWGSIYTTVHWKVQEPGYGYTGVGWYRYNFNIPKAFHGKKIWLYFDGLIGVSGRIYGEATVYVNGKNIGWTIDWLQPIKFDITEIINLEGENVVAVRISALGGANESGGLGAVILVGTDNEFNPGHGSANPPRKPTSFREIREKKAAKIIDKELMPFGAASVSENQKFNVFPISFKENDFVISSSGLYDAYITRSREFFRIHYQWDKPAKKGEYARIQGKIKIPELKGKKVYIRFWRRDNYGGTTYKGTPAKHDGNPNIRFKQLKINNKLVWQEDTFGDEKEVFVTVDITEEVKEDEYNEITFQLIAHSGNFYH